MQDRESVEGHVTMMLTARNYNRLVKSLLFSCVRVVCLEKCVHWREYAFSSYEKKILGVIYIWCGCGGIMGMLYD